MLEYKLKRLAISCGGTGGHFNPGLAVAREFAAKGGKVLLFLGGKHAEKQRETAKSYGIDSVVFPASPIKSLKFPFVTVGSLAKCLKAFLSFKPQALLSMGSFYSLSPCLAAKMLFKPLFLHDGNAKLGKANRFLSRFAKAMALSFPVVNESSSKCPCVVTGLPLRQEMTDRKPMSREEAFAFIRNEFGKDLDPKIPTFLVFGGSLGAASINNGFYCSEENLQVIHLCGNNDKNLEEVTSRYAALPFRSLVMKSCSRMDVLYAACDAVFCRAGGSTVSELALFGKYAVLVPYPLAAELHQDDNAAFLAKCGGAEILPDDRCVPTVVNEITSRILASLDGYRAKGLLSLAAAKPDASARVIRMMENFI